MRPTPQTLAAITQRDRQWRTALGVTEDCLPHEAVAQILQRSRARAHFAEKLEAHAHSASTPGPRCRFCDGVPVYCQDCYVKG